MLQEKFFKRSSYSFGTVYGPPPSSYDQKVRAEQALNNDMEVDQATSRGTSTDDPANPAVDGSRNPRKADPQSPGSNSRKRKIPLWVWIVGGIALVALLVCLMLLKNRPNDETISNFETKQDVESDPWEFWISSEDSVGNYDLAFACADLSMKKVEGGTFTMGCADGQGGDCGFDEKPSHSVEVSDFWIGETEVTQALWKGVMGTNPSYFKGDDLPVENVSWEECQEFIQKLNELTRMTFRLPTEAEWEYAARGGNKMSGCEYAGDNNVFDVAWYYGNSCGKTHPVKKKRPNALGLYDMSGNVWEWCSDWYKEDYYENSPSTNPQGPSLGPYHVRRGGSWDNIDWSCRVSNRLNIAPVNRSCNLGFRLALSEISN